MQKPVGWGVALVRLCGSSSWASGMSGAIRLGLVGDYDDTVPAHRAIPIALKLSSEWSGLTIDWDWVPTGDIVHPTSLERYHGLWCVPASPYRSMNGALLAIQFARETGLPFLGTCGGFQHALIEHARNVLGWADAEHAESAPQSQRHVVAPLACARVNTAEVVYCQPRSLVARAYECGAVTEEFCCRYGLNPRFEVEILQGPLRASARSGDGQVLAVERSDHGFFIATLFQPERAALAGRLPPIVAAFVRAATVQRGRRRPTGRPRT